MAFLMQVQDNRSGYLEIIDYVRDRGRQQPSRNGDTLEVDDLIIELEDPTRAIPCGVGRQNYNLALGALEALQLIGGFLDDELLMQVAPNIAQFAEENGKFYGGYGRRIEKQAPLVLDRLKADPETRQCVLTLWDPKLDAAGGKKDHPCTIALNFRVRDDKLLMSTYMRSQDAHWGWPYDAVAFTGLQLTVANFLGIPAGPYTHHAASFHIYTKDLEALEALTPYDGETDIRVAGLGLKQDTWKGVQREAKRLVKAAQEGKPSYQMQKKAGPKFYYEALRNRLEVAGV